LLRVPPGPVLVYCHSIPGLAGEYEYRANGSVYLAPPPADQIVNATADQTQEIVLQLPR
jgi:hypothetical protein